MRRDLGSSPGIRDGLLLLATRCCCSVTRLYLTLYNPRDCSMPGFPVLHHRHLTKLMSSESVIPSKHLILCWPLLLLPAMFPTIRVFSNESALHIRWPKYWSFSFNISPSSEYSELISFRIDLLAVQGTLKSLLQHRSLKASILCCSAFFMVQLTHCYLLRIHLDVLFKWYSFCIYVIIIELVKHLM